MSSRRAPWLVAAGALVLALASCWGDRTEDAELGRRPDAQEDYRIFAARCSKCHSLARPLNSGIEDDEHWERYVARMRRQPGSGISEQDSVAILRFLHLYSLEERRKRGGGEAVDVQRLPADASTPTPEDASPSPGAEPR
jgi:hypothetical protein